MQPMMTARSRTRSSLPSGHRGRGFSLVELLVAVLVMGIGVLGVSALQMVSLQNNQAALERGEAVHLAYDMMDRMRANPGGAYGGLAFGDPPPDAPDCVANACTVDQMRQFDEASWKCLLGNFNDEAVCVGFRDGVVLPLEDDQPGLPGGDGEVSINGDVITVSVRWMSRGGQQDTVTIDSQE